MSAEHHQPDLIPFYPRHYYDFLNGGYSLLMRSNVVIDEGFLVVNLRNSPKKRPKMLKAIKEGHENFEKVTWVSGSVGSLSDAAL